MIRVPRGRTFSRTRIPAAPDVSHRNAPVGQLFQAWTRKAPRTHVLRLFLHPYDFAYVLIALQNRLQIISWKWIKLFDSNGSDAAVIAAEFGARQIDANFAAR